MLKRTSRFIVSKEKNKGLKPVVMSNCKGAPEAMGHFLASNVSKLVGDSNGITLFLEALCNDYAQDFGGSLLEADPSPVIWVVYIAFSLIEVGQFGNVP